MQEITQQVFENQDPATLMSRDLHSQLAGYINRLIQSDFEKLLTLLYRVDVSEEKLKSILKNKPEEAAGEVIASLIIERQLEKLNFRKNHPETEPESGEERW